MEKIRDQILETEIQLGQSRQENFDMKEALDHCYDLFINTYKYWKKGTYAQKMRLQSSIFSKKPSYFYPTFGTPEFSLIFQQKRDLTHVKSLLVDHSIDYWNTFLAEIKAWQALILKILL